MKKNKKSILGVTLVEILIGIVISSIMMAAMFASYTVVNNTYSRVSDVAGISRSGRDIVSMLMRLELSQAGDAFLGGNYQLYNVLVTSHAFLMIFFFVLTIKNKIFTHIYIKILI